jgi:hypothetical protein
MKHICTTHFRLQKYLYQHILYQINNFTHNLISPSVPETPIYVYIYIYIYIAVEVIHTV